MSFRSLTLILSLFISSLFGIAHADPLDAKTCKNWAADDWDIYLEDFLFAYFSSQSPAKIYSNLQETLTNCKSNIEKLKIQNCLARPMGYYKQFSRSGLHIGSVGLDGDHGPGMFSAIQSNKSYYANQPQQKMEIPSEFRDVKGGLPKNWKTIAKKKGWEWVLFHSYVGNSARVIFIIPHDGYRQHLMYYSLNAKDADPNWEGIQMQMIEEPKDGQATAPPKVHFREWSISEPNHKPQLGAFSGRCVGCHSSGPRTVFPRREASFPTQLSEGTKLSQFNERLNEGVTAPDFSENYDLANFPHDLKVGEKAKCTECHDGKQQSSLAYVIDDHGKFLNASINSKVLLEKSMPYREKIPSTDAHRRLIVSQIQPEYYEKLKSWLTEIKCDPTSATVSPNKSQMAPGSKPTQ